MSYHEAWQLAHVAARLWAAQVVPGDVYCDETLPQERLGALAALRARGLDLEPVGQLTWKIVRKETRQ